MDVILLRKLSSKSLLGFGKYADMTVSQVIAINKKIYLKWCYYNLSNISFIDEILDELYIIGDYVIEKPGTDAKKWNDMSNYMNKYIGAEGMARKARHKKRQKANSICNNNRLSKLYYKKSVLRYLNNSKT